MSPPTCTSRNQEYRVQPRTFPNLVAIIRVSSAHAISIEYLYFHLLHPSSIGSSHWPARIDQSRQATLLSVLKGFGPCETQPPPLCPHHTNQYLLCFCEIRRTRPRVLRIQTANVQCCCARGSLSRTGAKQTDDGVGATLSFQSRIV